jgi:hypothetical protein
MDMKIQCGIRREIGRQGESVVLDGQFRMLNFFCPICVSNFAGIILDC